MRKSGEHGSSFGPQDSGSSSKPRPLRDELADSAHAPREEVRRWTSGHMDVASRAMASTVDNWVAARLTVNAQQGRRGSITPIGVSGR